MRKCFFVWMALLTTAIGVAGTVCVEYPASVRMKESGMSFAPTVFMPGWALHHASYGNGTGHTEMPAFVFRLGGAIVNGRMSAVAMPEGRVSVRWFWSADRHVAIEQMFIGSSLPSSFLRGGFYVTDGKRNPFPKPGELFHFGRASAAKKLSLQDREGKICVSIDFDQPTLILFQDDQRFGGGFSVRFLLPDKNLEPGRQYALGMTLSGPDALELTRSNPVTIAAGAEWRPIAAAGEIKKGSALDFSRISGIDAPAGKHGRVIVRDGHFAFERGPDTPQRFYGVNLCFAANFHQTREEADRFADRLARFGYNAVRLHHHDGGLVEGMKDSVTMNPVRLRELDALVAALISRGIYISTDLFVSRRVPWREIGENRDGHVEMQEFKDLVRVNDRAYENLAACTRIWLTHVNPYTGRRWADEPGVAWISFVNENCPDNSRKISPEARTREVEAENRFFARMKKVLREEIGAKQLLTDLNGWSQNPQWNVCRQAFDYVDMHFYVDHPRFIETPWRLPSACANVNPILGKEPHGVASAGRTRVAGKPFTLTEWNFSAPGRYRGVGGIVTGAWAAREDWDGLWRFAWSHDIKGVKNQQRKAMGYFDVSGDPLTLASERATLCLFLRRDLKTGLGSGLAIDGKKGMLSLNTPRTCGAFAEGGRVTAGALSADLGSVRATVWVSALDEAPLASSARMLFTHLTDVQNSGTRYADDSCRVLLNWGGLPHLMRRGAAEVELRVNPGSFTVYALEADGMRVGEVPCRYAGGALRWRADVACRADAATYLYEIVRNSEQR